MSIRLLLSVFPVLAAVVTAAPAQLVTALPDIRVTLVAGPTPARGGRTEVVRRANRSPENLVIVDRNANAEDLAAALVLLNALRAQHGDNLTEDLRARTDQQRPGPRFRDSAYHTWLVQQLVRLRTAPPADLADLGNVRAVQITLPARSVIRSPKGPE